MKTKSDVLALTTRRNKIQERKLLSTCVPNDNHHQTFLINTLTEVNITTVVLFGRLERYFGKVLIEVDICAALACYCCTWAHPLQLMAFCCSLHLLTLLAGTFQIERENVQSCQDSFTMAPPSFRYQTNDEMRTLLAALLVAVLLSITSSSTSLHKKPAKQITASSHLNAGIPAIIYD